jgi:cytochrome c oxidase assembly protein subunit 15
MPEMDFAQAFQMTRELGRTPDGTPLSGNALAAIHWSHRAGALMVALLVSLLCRALLQRIEWRNWGWLLGTMLIAQIGLGIANIVLSLPLPVALAHNAGAATLLSMLLTINFRLWQASSLGKHGKRI